MIKVVLTDVEGTTTSLSFVKDVLFPYARERMRSFLNEHQHDMNVRKQLEAVASEVGSPLTLEQSIEQLIQWIDEDKKVTALKAIQGMIWVAGYKNGDYTGHVYEDAVTNLKQWHSQGIRLYVFSSGSVQAQQLIYGYSDAGDLTPLFSGYFDTKIGAKRDVDAYKNIASEINESPEQILFLSDIKEELDAAKHAGMQTLWLVREGEIDERAAHTQVPDFNAINL